MADEVEVGPVSELTPGTVVGAGHYLIAIATGLLIVLILGGYGRLYGAFVGAVAYMLLEHVLAKAYPTAWQLGLGLTLVAVALFARNGIIGIIDALRRRLSAWRTR